MEVIDLAKKLRELRVLRGMSQEYLADQARVSLRTIQRIENNESEPTGETVKRIAMALDVALSDLIGTHTLSETNDLKSVIIFLKKQLNKTDERSEVKVFKNFIALLERLKEKDLKSEQLEKIEGYLQYLELEKTPSFSYELYAQKLKKFKKFLKNKLYFVPSNFYTTYAISFAVPFTVGFAVQGKLDFIVKIGVAAAALSIIGICILLDTRIKKQERALSFDG